jgi:hypothetical protein
MAKMTRERAVMEKRARKQEKLADKKQAAADRAAAIADGTWVEPVEGEAADDEREAVVIEERPAGG